MIDATDTVWFPSAVTKLSTPCFTFATLYAWSKDEKSKLDNTLSFILSFNVTVSPKNVIL